MAADEWQGWAPSTNTATYPPASAHPNSIDQDYYVSWNNKQAYDYSAADCNFSWGAVQRADLLDQGVKAYLEMRDGPFQPEPMGPRSKKGRKSAT